MLKKLNRIAYFMSKNTMYTIGAAVIILLGVGVFLLTRNSPTAQPMAEQNTGTPTAETKPQDSNAEPTASAAKPENLNGCSRTVDRSKMTAATVDFANKKVTLQVKGLGNIVIDLYDKDAPKTVENFVRLAGSGYFDCLTFHRVAKGFVIQGGDPTGTGSGGETALGTTLVDELNQNTESYKAGYLKGVVAMANRGPNTNSSQFFIMLGNADLPHQYTIFGKVSSGIEVVDKIGAMEIVPELGPTDGKPKQMVVIEKALVSNKQ